MNSEKLLYDLIEKYGGELVARNEEIAPVIGKSAQTIAYYKRLLIQAGYIETKVKVVDGKCTTFYKITKEYVDELPRLNKLVDEKEYAPNREKEDEIENQPNENNWSEIKAIQLEKYAEYYAKMEFTKRGFYVYSSEDDDHGVDFIVENKENSELYKIQVKGVRKTNHVSIAKTAMKIDEKTFVCFVKFIDGEMPKVYVIPSSGYSGNISQYEISNFNKIKDNDKIFNS